MFKSNIKSKEWKESMTKASHQVEDIISGKIFFLKNRNSIFKWVYLKWKFKTCIYTEMEYYLAIKIKKSCHLQKDMAKPWEHYNKWNKSEREGQILYDPTCVWNIKTQTYMQRTD